MYLQLTNSTMQKSDSTHMDTHGTHHHRHRNTYHLRRPPTTRPQWQPSQPQLFITHSFFLAIRAIVDRYTSPQMKPRALHNRRKVNGRGHRQQQQNRGFVGGRGTQGRPIEVPREVNVPRDCQTTSQPQPPQGSAKRAQA